ncbi:aminotransferase class I/II-fold pyridoxal phosphate-dependent enzyme [Natranaerobius trueperi]|uniref:Arginine decarboxylase n=1 Tax=Natranaerobius trueperi TaxID=759412 RepID=A0A226BZ85_9FIRM|nr:aminotransferase class I/II-fold pyridoxal phosphate-dependent enzyme [Natranaerobius trueperi]OWZ83634.1 arginine decarboxylase [Natranaerobius trueperi]
MSETPILDEIDKYINQGIDRYHTPGHNGIEKVYKNESFLGSTIFQKDLTEVPGLDDLHSPESVIKKSQELAAEYYGSDFCHYLVNGSSAGIIAMVMATVGPGDRVLIPRNAHKSLYSALILNGAKPVYSQMKLGLHNTLPLNLDIEKLEQIINQEQDLKAIFITNPSYYGVTVDLTRIRSITDRPLLIDEAHGAHFNLATDFPISASEYGADIWVQSTHKTLNSLTQSSILHGKKGRVSKEEIAFMLQLIQTTSPSYLLMASIEMARIYNQKNKPTWRNFLDNKLYPMRATLDSIPGIKLLSKDYTRNQGFQLDPTKITVLLDELKINGYQLSDILRKEYNIQVELAEENQILLLVTPQHTKEQIERLEASFRKISKDYSIKGKKEIKKYKYELPKRPVQKLTPREATFRKGRYLKLSDSIGMVAKEFVIPYPPGIPLLVPGEVITEEVYEFLDYLTKTKVHCQGFSYKDSGMILVTE